MKNMTRQTFLVLFLTFTMSILLRPILVPRISYAQQQQQIPSSQQFTSSTTAKQVVDAYKAGIPFKKYIENALKNTDSPDNTIIKNQLSSGNVACGGSDAITKASTCDGVVSFAKLACEDNPDIYPNCSHKFNQIKTST